jgi:YVTN family beta-propeller protein
MRHRAFLTCLLVGLITAALGAKCGQPPSNWVSPHESPGQGLFTSPQSNPIALSPDGTRLYVANTTSNSLSIIDTGTDTVLKEIQVGIDPVAVAVRPDGNRVWVANHVSDSISIVNTDPGLGAAFENEVIETVQDIDGNGSTDFDEPVGIAFVDNTKAFVALSSRNQVVNVNQGFGGQNIGLAPLNITAQDPRAIAVRNGRLYVTAFESGNQSEVSACPQGNIGGEPAENCTLDQNALVTFATNPNIPGEDKNIIIDPDVPDRDLFVYDVNTHALLDTVEGVGTLLYGVAVASDDRVFVSQTEARNTVNGIEGDNLIDLDNRIFLNRITEVDCNGGSCGSPTFHELENLPEPECGMGGCGSHPLDGDQLATPYGIAISDDDSTLVVTAAASSRVFTVNAATGAVRDILDVGAIPRGVALASNGGGAPETAYVLNTLDNSVSVVDVSNPDAISLVTTISVGNDPTPEAVRLGRIAFNDATASDTGTFSCASCHPDGHTDQLLWRIGGACFFGACTGNDEPRSTMPIRGLDNTLPLHWDGTLGDPFGGGNGAVGGGGSGGTDCSLTAGDPEGDHGCFVDLVEESLSGVMCDQLGSCPPGGNQLNATERDDMARFLAAVHYPPARDRRIDDSVSASANLGFRDFFMDQSGGGNPNTCADMDSGCHALPLGAETNSSTLNGFDAPTMRGMTDRFLQFSLGVTAAEESLVFSNAGLPPVVPANPFPWVPSQGLKETTTFGSAFFIFTPVYGVGPVDMFRMFEEASTGTSGATGRQVTLHSAQWLFGGARAANSLALLDGLEAADARGVINLRGRAVRNGNPITISYDSGAGLYQAGENQISRATLEAEAEAGTLVVTFTGYLPQNFGLTSHTQPLLSPEDNGSGDTGNPDLPHLPNGGVSTTDMALTGEWVRSDSVIFLNGLPVAGTVECCDSIPGNGSCNVGGAAFSPFCSSELIRINLSSLPTPETTHLLQLQSPDGPLSNEIPICVDSAGVDDCL